MTIEAVTEKLGKMAVKVFEKNPRRFYIEIKPDNVATCAKAMFRDLNMRFATATGIDTPAGFEILYHFSDDKSGKIFTLKTLISKNSPEIDSVTPVMRGAEWIEREMYEMLGINFRNHPNLKRLLLSDDWPGGKYPLRQEPSS